MTRGVIFLIVLGIIALMGVCYRHNVRKVSIMKEYDGASTMRSSQDSNTSHQILKNLLLTAEMNNGNQGLNLKRSQYLHQVLIHTEGWGVRMWPAHPHETIKLQMWLLLSWQQLETCYHISNRYLVLQGRNSKYFRHTLKGHHESHV